MIHLKEYEFRYKENLYQILLRLIRKNFIALDFILFSNSFS
ncbi:Hypothetical protein HPV225_1425 [Helicobacter pylori v225d]|nr:Hypothetical protein HPV225_1035 [Helicobacter pylori v225d]ADI35456.1 Hypothetical protein HPV225_1425 [Helicobacter pylori v225d]